jgi:uncharacterized damage-inducible protein DinB
MHLHALFQGAHSYISTGSALAGLSTADADRRPSGAPHSIAEIVAHMDFWQGWFLDRCDGTATPIAAPASAGWPPVAEGEWDVVRARFESGFARAIALAKDASRIDSAIAPPIELASLARYTVRDALTHVALHNAHHLGQVITLRQQSGAWPPQGGSWTW